MRRRSLISAAALCAALPATLAAQQPTATQRAIASWQQLVAPTGHEALATGPLAAALPGWQRDAAGNLMLRRGAGSPRRVVACGLDRPGYAVSQITEAGLLRVHRVGSGGHALFDQAHEGQQVHIHTARGPVPGVAAIANGHFAAQHRGDTAIVTENDLWIDVGAASRAEVEALGIRLLDPLERRVPAWPYAGGVAGNGVGGRAACAAVVAASRGTVASGETIFLLTTQSVFSWPGLGAALARIGRVDMVTAVGGRRPAPVVASIAGVDSVRSIAPRLRHAGTLVETISDGDAETLLTAVTSAAGVDRATLPAMPWVEAPAPAPAAARPADAQRATASQLKQLADLPGVPGDEWRVRDAVRAALPAWARAIAETDAAGNLIVAAGPERDTLVFIAHLDEVSFDVASIASDGVVTLRGRGGAVASAWEGQPALLHLPRAADGTAAPSLPGIFVPRADPRTKRPERMTAWFGLDSAALVARGVRVGSGVTAYKDAVRLAGTRFTGRAMDDRAGTLALLRGIAAVDPARLTRRVLFVWSTEEEVGLNGAAALAARLGPSVRRVHSIDTFVSSESPLESPHFAFARLGDGPVQRGIESQSMTPPAAREEIARIARAAGIPLQTGLTQGGTDGTAFVFYGAPNVPLSWPGRYSHAPGEVLDLRDVERLGALIAAIAVAGVSR